MHTRSPTQSVLASVVALAAFVALAACEERMVQVDAPSPSLDTMPRVAQVAARPAPAQSGDGVQSGPGVPGAESLDAGAVATDEHHAVLVASCAIDRSGCLNAQPSPAPDASSYRIAFGGGAGAIRARGQAMADLYKEIRDRTEAGAHLVAETHHLGDPPPGEDGAKAAPRARSRVEEDPVVEAAFQLMEAVDRDGEVTIDSLPPRGANVCKLSLGALDADGGGGHCLVNAPDHGALSRPGRSR